MTKRTYLVNPENTITLGYISPDKAQQTAIKPISLDLSDFMRTDSDGRGFINILMVTHTQ